MTCISYVSHKISYSLGFASLEQVLDVLPLLLLLVAAFRFFLRLREGNDCRLDPVFGVLAAVEFFEEDEFLHLGGEPGQHQVHVLLGAGLLSQPLNHEHQLLEHLVAFLGLVAELQLFLVLVVVLLLQGSQVLLGAGV